MTDIENFLARLREQSDELADSEFWTRAQGNDSAQAFAFKEAMLVNRLTAARIERGMSQAELAKRMTARGFAMQQSTIAKLEKHDRPLRMAEFFALCATLGVPDFAVMMGVPLAEDADEQQWTDELTRQLRSDVARRERFRADLAANVEMAARLYAEADAAVLWSATKLQAAGIDAAEEIEKAKRGADG